MRSVRNLCRNAEGRNETLLIETDDHLIADEDDRHAHLAGFLYHFLALLKVARDIVVSEADSLLLEKVLGHLAEMASRGAVNSDVFIHVCFYYSVSIPLQVIHSQEYNKNRPLVTYDR